MKGLDPNGVHQARGEDELRRRLDEARQFHQRGHGTNGNGAFRDNSSASPSPDTNLPACSDEALALKFAAKHANDLRYTASWGRWQRFDGKRWSDDATLLAFDYARRICREACALRTITSAKTRQAPRSALPLFRSPERIGASPQPSDQWDSDPWVLNTPSGDHRPAHIRAETAAADRLFHQDHAQLRREGRADVGFNFSTRSPTSDKALAAFCKGSPATR